MRELTLGQITEGLDEAAKERVSKLLARSDVTGVVRFENQTLDSSNLGAKTLCAYGPGCTYRTLREFKGKHLYDLPSKRQIPVSFHRAEPRVNAAPAVATLLLVLALFAPAPASAQQSLDDQLDAMCRIVKLYKEVRAHLTRAATPACAAVQIACSDLPALCSSSASACTAMKEQIASVDTVISVSATACN
jgi:hypothetical protein